MKFWKRVLWIGLPVAIQNLISTILNMSDTLMISSLGDTYVSAVGLANKYFFVFSLLLFGIVSGCSVLLSQFYGKGDNDNLNKTFGFSMLLAMIGSLFFFLTACFMPSFIMGLFTKSDELIKIGSSYLKIVSFSYLLTAVSLGITGLLRSVNKTRIPMLITFCCVLINIFVNYLLIFGSLGAPKMNADGAAIGTLVSRFVEFIAIICYLVFTKKDFIISIRTMFKFSKKLVKRILHFASPVILNEFAWGLGTTIYSVIYGHISDDVVATMTIASTLQDLVWSLMYGVSASSAVLVGNLLGANNFDEAKITSKKLLRLSLYIATIQAIILVIIIKPYLLLYPNVSSNVKAGIFLVCIVFAIFMPFKSFNLTNICGVLRSGGDTIFCMVLDICGVWLVAIPLGLLGAFVFELPIQYVFIMIMFEEIFKFVIGLIRYKKNYWVKNIALNLD